MNINLLAIAPTEIIRNQGLDLLLNDFVETLNELDEIGIYFTFNNQKQIFHGFLAFCLGDNLALHWIGGFFESMGKAKRFCRHCEITYNERLDGDTAECSDLRLIERHLEALDMIENAESLKSIFGIKMRSPLLKLKNFNICNSLLQDPMHTLIQGVCMVELKFILHYILYQKNKNISYVNDSILNFEYGFLDHDSKPTSKLDESQIKNENFNLTASQMLTLMINFPVIFGDTFEENDVHWTNFLRLNKIVNIVFAFQYDDEAINALNLLINEYLENLKNFQT